MNTITYRTSKGVFDIEQRKDGSVSLVLPSLVDALTYIESLSSAVGTKAAKKEVVKKEKPLKRKKRRANKGWIDKTWSEEEIEHLTSRLLNNERGVDIAHDPLLLRRHSPKTITWYVSLLKNPSSKMKKYISRRRLNHFVSVMERMIEERATGVVSTSQSLSSHAFSPSV